MEQTNGITENSVLERYQKAIDYYWKASSNNKKSFKLARFSIIILGSLVTLMSSFSSASFIEDQPYLKVSFSVLTPLMAALMTIVGGIAQSFHWGAAWRDMVLNAENLEKARDLFLATKPEARDLKLELDKMHTMVINESKNFFQRVIESEEKPGTKNNKDTADI